MLYVSTVENIHFYISSWTALGRKIIKAAETCW
jgi:hypothetical protein